MGVGEPGYWRQNMAFPAARGVVRERCRRLFGQNFAFIKCSLAVYCYNCFWQRRQAVEVELIRRLVVKRPMRSGLVVEHRGIAPNPIFTRPSVQPNRDTGLRI